MTSFIKTEDLVSKNLYSVAPALSIFYKEEKIVELLKAGDTIAETLVRERQKIESEFRDGIARERKLVKEELEAMRQEAYKKAYEEGTLKAQEEVHQKFNQLLTHIEDTEKNIETTLKNLYKETEDEMVDLCLGIAEKLVQDELKNNREFFVKMIRGLLKKITDQKRICTDYTDW